MKEKRYYNLLNLQLFADEGADAGDSDTGNDESESNENESSDFKAPQSQSEVDSLVGKAVNTALKKAKADWEQQKAQDIEDAKTQAQKFGQMTAEEKAIEAERIRIEKIEERENALNKRELKTTAIDVLSEKGLPVELADILYYEDENTTKEHLDRVEKAFNKAVEAGVDKRLIASAQNIPSGSSGGRTMTTGETIAQELNKQQTTKGSFWD